MTIDYDRQFFSEINICRGAPQGSVFGPMAYVVDHCDLPQISDRPENVHLYVDDLAITYIPSIYLNHRNLEYQDFKAGICVNFSFTGIKTSDLLENRFNKP